MMIPGVGMGKTTTLNEELYKYLWELPVAWLGLSRTREEGLRVTSVPGYQCITTRCPYNRLVLGSVRKGGLASHSSSS